MNVTMSSRYLWGKYPLPWRLVNKRCPNFQKDFIANAIKYAGGNDVVHVHSVDADEVVDGVGMKSRGSSSSSSMMKYLTYGLPCDLAGLIKQHRLAKRRFNLSMQNLTEELVQRSIIWYGRPPDFHLQWLSLYK